MSREIIHSYHEAVIEGDMTPKQFYDQYETARDIVVGGKYAQKSIFSTYPDIIWEVLFIDGTTAFCRSVDAYNSSRYNYDMFVANGVMAGWRKNDPRACYRLYKRVES